MALPNIPLNIPIPKFPSKIVAPPPALHKKPIETKPKLDEIKITASPQVLESLVDSYTRISKMADMNFCSVPNLYVSYRYPITPNFAIIPNITFASQGFRCYLEYVKPKYQCEAVATSAYNYALHVKGNISNNFDGRVGLTYQDKQKLPLTTKILLTYRHAQFATDFIYRTPSYFSTTFLYRLTESFAAGGEFVISPDKLKTQGKTGETISSFSKELYKSFALFGRYSDEANTLQSALCHTHKDYGIKIHYLRSVNDNTKLLCTTGFTVDKQTNAITSDARIGYHFHLPHQNTTIKGFYAMSGTIIAKIIEDIGNNSFLSFEAIANPFRDAYAFQLRLCVNGMPPQPSSFYSPSLHENSMMY